MNLAQALIHAFTQEGITLGCGMGGNSTRAMADAAYSHPDMRILYTRNERSAVDAADGYGRIAGKPALIFTDAGPAAANCLCGIVNAHGDSTPMIFIAPSHNSLTNQHRAYKEMPLQAVYSPVTKWTGRIYDERELGQVVRKIFTLLRSGRPSPIVVEVPGDLAGKEIGDYKYEPLAPQKLRSGADPASLESAARMLIEAKRPLLYAGHGVLIADASAELLELAELLTVPVAVTLAGKSCFPDDHPLCVGIGGWPRGLYATPHATRRTKDADVILTIGCSFQLEASYDEFAVPFKMIQIDVDANEMNKKRPADIPLLGDAKVILQQLVETVKAMLPKSRLAPQQDVLDAIAGEQKAWMEQSMPLLTSQDNPINPFRVTWEFSKLVDPRRTIVTHDSGSSRGTLSQHYMAPTPRSFVAFGVQSGMGWTLGAAMGMKLAAPDKLVTAFVGDEAFGETAMELETAARNKLPVLWVLLNNRLPREQLDLKKQPVYADRHALTGDYVAMAKALGCEASRVEDPAQLSAALKRSIDAVNGGAPTLLEVKTRRVEAQLWGKIQR